MFDAIAPRYDLLNHLLSGGLDRRWRTKAVRALALRGGETVLDLCTGTADLAIASATASPGAARGRRRRLRRADAPPRPGQTRRARPRRASQAGPGRRDAHPARRRLGGRGDGGVRDPERRASRGGLRRRVPGAASGRPLRDPGIRRAADARSCARPISRTSDTSSPESARCCPATRRRTRICRRRSGRSRSPSRSWRRSLRTGFSQVTADSLSLGIVYLYSALKPDQR